MASSSFPIDSGPKFSVLTIALAALSNITTLGTRPPRRWIPNHDINKSLFAVGQSLLRGPLRGIWDLRVATSDVTDPDSAVPKLFLTACHFLAHVKKGKILKKQER